MNNTNNIVQQSLYYGDYEVICTKTGEVIARAMAYAPLEQEYAGYGNYFFIRNIRTGVEWYIPE